MLGHKASRFVLPLTALMGAVVFYAILQGKPEPKARPIEPAALPVVDVETVSISPQRLWIETQGVVEPAIEISLESQVSGRVEWVSSQFANGGYFNAGDKLVGIEAADYEIALSQARSSLAEARRVLAQER